MKNSIKKILSLLFVAVALFLFAERVSAQTAPVDTLLNGKIFTVKLEEDMGKKNKSYDDEFMFKGDKLKSKRMTSEFEFKSGKFKAALDPNSVKRKINFECTIKNAKEEEVNFTGSVTDNEIEGTAEWNKKDGTTKMMYNIEGAIKEKKVPGQKAKSKKDE